ncbi:MAG: uL30 family ribosomal protein [Candidatus Nanoarchaeia archaeon]|nr:uL30 family ribosomal protein [Candidatus Nanoarchaeia archaeon]MDD5741734.1 uL30 family ribosomal protein [Candidatus Nanoarchaeia archaeon]
MEKQIKNKPEINKTQGENKNSSSPKKLDAIDSDKNKLIVIIRISGMVKINRFIEDTLYRMRLRRKYACVVIKPTKDILGMLEKVRHYVAYGEINKETYEKLLKARGKKVDGKLKPFFRLHPPRGGIVSKRPYNLGGVLGPNKEINELVERML